MHRVEEIPSLIVACCALHNFITMHENIDDTDIDVEIDQVGETFVYIIDIIYSTCEHKNYTCTCIDTFNPLILLWR